MIKPLTEEEVRLLDISNQLQDLSAKASEIQKTKREGGDVHRAIEVLDKDVEVVRAAIYAVYILAQNNEDPL